MDFVSVVVPSHNRRAAVSRLLRALADQDYPLDSFEVIVVADGCSDDTCDVLSKYCGPFAFRLIEQAGSGPAGARNRGAAVAKGEWLLFLDDDVVPTPELVTAHVRAHRRSPGGVVVGPYLPAHAGTRLLDLELQNWWRTTFEELQRVGYRHNFMSVLTGNLSLRTELFGRLGGFDMRFQAHEDYELGARLIESDIPIAYEPAALALHHHESDIAGHIRRKGDEGRADVMLVERYPNLATELPIYRLIRSRAWRDRIVRWLALRRIPVGFLAAVLPGLLYTLEKAGLPEAWRSVRRLLDSYTYLRAVADHLGGGGRVGNFCSSIRSLEPLGGRRLELDLSHGIADAERQLDLVRPAGARIRYRSRLIGVIHCRPGAEPLRGIHLRPALAREMAMPLLEAMALDGAIADGTPDRRQMLFDAIGRQRNWFGPVRPGQMWFEQYSQWQQFERPETAEERTAQRFSKALADLAREIDWLDDEYREASPRTRAEGTAR